VHYSLVDFRLLGPLEIWDDGRQLAIGSAKQRALLAILLLNANRVVPTSRLIELLWGDEPSETVANTLQVAVSQLRKILEKDHPRGTPYQVLVSQPPGYLLRVGADQLDLYRFEQLRREADQASQGADPDTTAARLRGALNLWRGPALADVAADPFALAEGVRLNELRIKTLEDRIEAELSLGRHGDLIGELQALVTEYPLRERLRGQLMLALYRSGRQAEASELFHKTRALLIEELGMEPGPGLQRLFKAILNQEVSVAPARSRTDNLPTALTTFIGRTEEVHDVKERLSGVRLLTLTGIGGVGKTRLALQVAKEVLTVYPHGVWFVDLAPLNDGAFVPDAVASVLGLRELAGRTVVEGLTAYFGTRTALLILDNCEHLVEPVAALGRELLRTSPDLTILATSREPLDIMGEATVRVDPLPVPEPGRSASQADILEYAAVALLVDRARLAVSSFELSEVNMAVVIKICERLEGIPLAIELACAKFGVLPLEQVSARLDDRFRLLAGSRRGVLARHQTLEATLDWSYDLLDGQERTLLARLSVFSGGASFGAVQAVCRDQDVGLDILEPLSRLVTKSLVTLVQGDAEARYRLLETVRSYASQRLSASGDAGVLRGRHFDWYLALAEEAQGELFKSSQGTWIRRLEREYENIRTALEWSTATRPNDGLRLAVALYDFWVRKARYNEVLEWLQRSLAASSDRSGVRATGLTALGAMVRSRGDHELARQLMTEAMQLANEIGDLTAKAWAAEKLAMVLEDEGSPDAIPLFEESVALGRKANPLRLLSALNNLGLALHRRGDRSGAPRSLLAEGLMLARERGDHWAIASILDGIAQVALDTADLEAARLHWNESLRVAFREGYQYFVPSIFEGVAKLSLVEGQPDRALRLLGAAERYRREKGETHSLPIEGDALQQLTRDARQALSSDRAEIIWTEGQGMPLDEALRYATRDSAAPQPAIPAKVR